MIPSFDLTFLVMASIAVVGVLEWLKGFVTAKVPTWTYRLALLPISFIVAAAGVEGMMQILTTTFMLLSITNICYPLLIQLPTSLIAAFKNKLGG